MTRRERLEMVIRGEISEELVEECKREIEKMDRELAKLRENDHYDENRAYEERICAALCEESEPIEVGELAERISSTLTRQRLTAICTNLIREGKIKSCDMKTPKGKRKGYYI